jgi:acyl-CoA thioester hydrolase
MTVEGKKTSQTKVEMTKAEGKGLLDAPVQRVLPEWIDGNGHMNVAYYSLIFDRALDSFFETMGIGWDYTNKGVGSAFVLEAHVSFLREVKVDDPLRVTFQLLDYDEKRIHYFEQMFHASEGFLAATSEQIAIHIDMKSRRSSPFPADVLEKLKTMRATHEGLAIPAQAGRVIRIDRKPPRS